MKNIFRLVLLGASFILLMQASTRAEGGGKRTGGDNGINRRVVTKAGYSQVSGSATISFGPDATLGQKNWSTYRDSPTFYLGATGGTEVDAGFQYDLNSPPSSRAGQAVSPPDKDTWWLFIRRSGGNMNPEMIWDKSQGSIMWQGGSTTSLSSGNLTFRILEKPETSAQGVPQRVGCMSLRSAKTGEAFYFTSGNAQVTSKLAVAVQKQAKVMQVDSIEGMTVGDDVTIGTDSGIITAVDLRANTISINFPLGSNYAAGVVVKTTYRSKTILQNQVAANATQITVQPGSGLEKNDEIRVGDDEAVIVSEVPGTPNSFNIISTTGLSVHPAGTPVTWLQLPNRAYANHPVAPWYGEPVFPSSNPSAKMKRVVGMTRDTTEELDGSWLTSTFSDGMVKLSGDDYAGGWGTDDVDQSPTGYDATESGAEAYDQRASTKAHALDAKQLSGGEPVTGVSKTKVEFPNLTVEVTSATTLPPHKVGETLKGEDANLAGRKDTHDSRVATEGGVSRYSRETVNINLRQYTTKKASAVQPTKP